VSSTNASTSNKTPPIKTPAGNKRVSVVPEDGSRAKILDSALRLLTDEGHPSLTIRRVAAEAGCSTIGVYTWFGGKDGLIDAIWIEGFASFAAALNQVKRADGPLGLLRAQAVAYRKWALQHPRHYRVMFMNAVVDHEPSAEALAVSMSAFHSLQRAVQDAADRNELTNSDLAAIALACWGTAHGLVSIELGGTTPPSVASKEARLADRAFSYAIDAMMAGFSRTP
jgi:AcrR family transcriptional regulator